jgi:hypothetical protein
MARAAGESLIEMLCCHGSELELDLIYGKKNSTGEGKATLTDIVWGRHSRRTQPIDD